MNPKSLSRHVRLLPAVMLIAAGLLAAKGADLVEVARAEAAPASADNSAAPATPDSAKPQAHKDAVANDADDDASDSSAEVDVLTSLAQRRTELDAREKALDMRANLLTAAENRIDSKIGDLKALQIQIQALLGKRDDAEKQQVASLVKVYSSMKPRDAARIFDSLDGAVLLDVAREMKPDSLAAIMAAMNPEQAQALTVKLANRLDLPAKPELPVAQLAAATPAPAANPPQQAAAPATAPQAQPGAAPQPGG